MGCGSPFFNPQPRHTEFAFFSAGRSLRGYGKRNNWAVMVSPTQALALLCSLFLLLFETHDYALVS